MTNEIRRSPSALELPFCVFVPITIGLLEKDIGNNNFGVYVEDACMTINPHCRQWGINTNGGTVTLPILFYDWCSYVVTALAGSGTSPSIETITFDSGGLKKESFRLIPYASIDADRIMHWIAIGY